MCRLSGTSHRRDRVPAGVRRLTIAFAVALFALIGCGESGQHFAEQNVPIPSNDEIEKRLTAFEVAVRSHRPAEVCRYLTARSLRELLTGPQGQTPSKPIFSRCADYIALREKSGTKPFSQIEVTKVTREEYEGRSYLVVYVEEGPGLIMSNNGKRIESFGGPE